MLRNVKAIKMYFNFISAELGVGMAVSPRCCPTGSELAYFWKSRAEAKRYYCATPGSGRKGRPSRISFEKSGESLAARARVSIKLRVFSSAKGSPPVRMRWRSYKSSSPLPLSRMRQSHGRRSWGGCWVRMLVVQLVVMALYQRGSSGGEL